VIDRMRTLRLAELRRTTAFRLTAGLCAVFAVAVIGLLGLTYTLTAQQLFTRTDQILDGRMESILRAPTGDEVEATKEALAAEIGGWSSSRSMMPMGGTWWAICPSHSRFIWASPSSRPMAAPGHAAAPAGRADGFGRNRGGGARHFPFATCISGC
jgi:hypothetical protein